MQLTDEQKQHVAAWIAQGVKLSDIQTRLAAEYGLRLTYMEARLLVDDLRLTPKDPEPEKATPVPDTGTPAAPDTAAPTADGTAPGTLAEPAGAGAKITLTADTIARPGTMVSGSVTFSDGKKAAWYLDQVGRLGVVPDEQGYRPPAGDVEQFQVLLDRELQKLGY